jgi:hypothetical protein
MLPPRNASLEGTQLETSAVEEEGVALLAYKSCEGRIDIAAGAGVEDLNLLVTQRDKGAGLLLTI